MAIMTLSLIGSLARRFGRFSMTTACKNDLNTRLIWIDCEMTGLDVDRDTLVEIACVITSGDNGLDTIAQSPNLVIHQSELVIDRMSNWCKNQFVKNGLLTQIRQSDLSMTDAEDRILTFVREYTEEQACPLAGNSVETDRLFLQKWMPRLACHLHYRTVDVSTVKELCRRWFPKTYVEHPEKQYQHRALNDIRESIEELRFYKSRIFR